MDGRLAIHYAAMNGHSMSVLTLAAYGADVNSCTKNGRTALHGACWNGHTQAALQLIEMGADPNARAADGAIPLIDAARNGHCETVTALVSIVGADVSTVDRNGRACLHFAAINGHPAMVHTLVKLGADVDCKDHDGCRPLHLAAWSGHRDTVMALLCLGADPRAHDGNLSTALHDAALSGRAKVAALLISSKADVEARNNRGITPLHSAASSGHVETTCLLLDAKADINAVNDDKRSALHFATWNCHPRTVFLLLKCGADMSVAGVDGIKASECLCHPDFDWPADLVSDLHLLRLPNSPMHTAAGLGDSRRVTSLAGYGVDVNCPNIVGDTPLHWAVRNRRLGASTRLLELGADMMRSNDKGVTARMDLMTYMDLVQQEKIKRKLIELAQQVRSNKSGPPAMAKAGACKGVSSAGVSSPDAHSPRHFAGGLSSAGALASSLAASDVAQKLEGVKQIYRRTPAHVPTPVNTPPRSPRHSAPTLGQLHGAPHSLSPPHSPAASGPPVFVETSAHSCVSAATPEREGSGQNPRDCNPDDVHNLSSTHDHSTSHPIRYACMQVRACTCMSRARARTRAHCG